MISSSSKSTVSNAAVRDVYNACQRLGLLSGNDLAELDLDPECFNDPEARLPESTLIQLWQKLEQFGATPDIGLKIGQTIAPDSKGILASWVSQAHTLGEAFEIFLKNISLMNPSEKWLIDERNLHVTLTLINTNSQRYPTSATERSMSAMVSWARALSAHPIPLTRASFTFVAPAHAHMFTPIFGERIQFEADKNSLTFDKKLLKLPVLSSNKLLKSLLEERARTVLSRLSDDASLVDKVALLIRNAITEGQTISNAEVCQILAKSRQTLYRQLKSEGADFRALYDQVRKEQAVELLANEKASISGISLQLGFKDESSFYKAFKRWTGMSPKNYIEQSPNT